MSASVESIHVQRPHGAVRSAQCAPTPREGVLRSASGLALQHGGWLAEVKIAWRLAGADDGRLVCALGGISAGRYACLSDEPPAWWSEVIGPAGALDTERYRVLSFDYLGGSGESTAPEAGCDFPSISSYDQAEALARLLDHLGIASLDAIVGGSYGGMVALAFAERYPDRVGRLVVIGAADRTHPLATAWRSVQRHVVRFAASCGKAEEGVKLARALAMATYRSPEEFAARFSEPPERDGAGFVFPVEQYLIARGGDYARRYRAESYLCLSESIDLHRIDAERVFVPTAVVATREDQLVPLADLRALAARLPLGRLHEISSIYGHDAFLKESHQLRSIFGAALGSVA